MSMTPLTVAPIFRGAVDLRDAVSTRMDVHRRRCWPDQHHARTTTHCRTVVTINDSHVDQP
jgi:hypothetical protein